MKIIANVDPRCPLPQWLLNFAMKKMVGVLLYFLNGRAKKVTFDSVYERRAKEGDLRLNRR